MEVLPPLPIMEVESTRRTPNFFLLPRPFDPRTDAPPDSLRNYNVYFPPVLEHDDERQPRDPTIFKALESRAVELQEATTMRGGVYVDHCEDVGPQAKTREYRNVAVIPHDPDMAYQKQYALLCGRLKLMGWELMGEQQYIDLVGHCDASMTHLLTHDLPIPLAHLPLSARYTEIMNFYSAHFETEKKLKVRVVHQGQQLSRAKEIIDGLNKDLANSRQQIAQLRGLVARADGGDPSETAKSELKVASEATAVDVLMTLSGQGEETAENTSTPNAGMVSGDRHLESPAILPNVAT
ncbi:hypothetical protein P7C73_g6190, partial [Tremellales sp. Uapishka_1]